jgi:hypothetical protein
MLGCQIILAFSMWPLAQSSAHSVDARPREPQLTWHRFWFVGILPPWAMCNGHLCDRFPKGGDRMARHFWSGGLVLLTMVAWASAEDKETKAPPAAKHPGLERLKKLTGEWVATDEQGKPTAKLVSVFKVTAAGSAVHETIFPGQPHEMVTLYHLDGPDLVLTHYCAAGNQPHMKADPKSPPNQLRFQFAGGSNLNAAKDMHMHEGSITFVDDDHIEWSWVGYQDGKPADGHQVSLKLARKK